MEDDILGWEISTRSIFFNADIFILEDANCNSPKRDSTPPIESGSIILVGRDVI